METSPTSAMRALAAFTTSIMVLIGSACDRAPDKSADTGVVKASPADAGEAVGEGVKAAAPTPKGLRRAAELNGRVPVTWAQIQKASRLNAKALKKHRAKDYRGALKNYEAAWAANPNHILSRYNAACAHALLGDLDEAMAMLGAIAKMGGFRAHKQLRFARKDTDMKALHTDPAFIKITEVEDPTPAFIRERDDIETERALDFNLLSDPEARVCVWLYEGDDRGGVPTVTLRVYDCQTNQALTTREIIDQTTANAALDGSPAGLARYHKKMLKADAWLEDLGMVEWAPLKKDEQTSAEAWFSKKVEDLEEMGGFMSAFRSPDGALIGMRLSRMVVHTDPDHSYKMRPAKVVLGP